VELQRSAYPYHDWNELVTAECYAPNAASRILDNEKKIAAIVNNYARISFDFGPTLLSWLEKQSPKVYEAILSADIESQKLYSGHGSALAQAYNHMIMPLANRRDKYTQILWGISDFKRRFRREPEGMWLPETAVDLETLEIMAELGIKFTILAPHQAKRVRKIGEDKWEDVSGARIDPTRAYQVRLPSDRALNLFFYDGPASRAVAFEGLLSKGENFASRLTGLFFDQRTWSQLVHIATDGESYGHHHRFGDMALAYAINHIEANKLAKITNYGEYLEKNPPTHEVEIFENTSWSCSHGIERWRSDCGCNSGGNPGWHQAWRAPLRAALDWLRDTLAPKYEKEAAKYVKDPWSARNDYIDVILERSDKSLRRFFEKHAAGELSEADTIRALKLFELQRHAMLMYTSCGWFFDDISGIETVQVIQYAGRAVQLAEELFGNDTEGHFLSLLEAAKSNVKEHGNGRRIYEKWVKRGMVDLTKVAAHYAISSLFEKYKDRAKIYCYSIDVQDYQTVDCGKAKVAVGKVKVTSDITRESDTLSFGVIHFGDHNVNAGVRHFMGDEPYQRMVQETMQACSTADFPEVIRLLDKHFGTPTYSLNSLFHDERLKILDRILESTLSQVELAYRQLYDAHYPLMRFLTEGEHSLPKALESTAEFIVNIDLRRALTAEVLNPDEVKRLLGEANLWRIALDASGLSYEFQRSIEKKMADFAQNPQDMTKLKEVASAIELAESLPFSIDLWQAQNMYYVMLKTVFSEYQEKAGKQKKAQEWVAQFALLGEKLAIRVPGADLSGGITPGSY